jgi:ribosomal protein L3 glutamine methyltransferase
MVNSQVLVPRSPLAELIPERFSPWLKLHAGGKILDMCTGGGCIAIAMAVYMPECEVDAVDLSEEALQVASQNIERHGVGERVRLIHSDLFSAVEAGAYDLIVSNPPYVSTDVFEKLPAEYRVEPSGGLVCGEDGLEIVLKIMDAAPDYLHQQGILIVEVGESAETLMDILPRVPFFWFDFEEGGDGIFMLEYDQLIACQPDLQTVLEQRKYV